MASFADIPFKYYNCETDEYRLPGGRVISGDVVREAKQGARDRVDAAMAYDPYNHIGRAVREGDLR